MYIFYMILLTAHRSVVRVEEISQSCLLCRKMPSISMIFYNLWSDKKKRKRYLDDVRSPSQQILPKENNSVKMFDIQIL